MSTVHIEPAASWGAGDGRVYVKRQREYFCRPVWRFGRRTPLLVRELRGLNAARRLGLPVPEVVAFQQADGESVLVLREIAGARALREALLEAGQQRQALVARVGALIGKLHSAGWVHGALYSDHLLVGMGADPVVYLIDFEKATRNPLRRVDDLERFWRRNDYLTDRDRLAFETAYRRARRR